MLERVTLSPAARTSTLERFRSGGELDVLVVGGGVVGCGAALDAVTRGLSTGLIEARDYASGTSSRSSKLIHGGLRYLEMLDFGLVHEALQERRLLLTTIAPHLVRPVPFMYPLSKPAWERFYVGSGIALYDGLAFGVRQTAGLPRHRHLGKKAALRLMPSLRPDALTGAIQYHDAQVDDARFVLELARTAAQHGAHVINRVAATSLLRSDDGERVVGVRARDNATGEELDIRARRVVAATGVWTDEIQSMLGDDGPLKVRSSKGIHLVVPRDRITSETGVILRTEKSVLFIIPWDEHWIIGTTDTDWSLDKAHPAATSADIDYLLETVNSVLVTPLTRDDIDGVYAGLRPLISGDDSDETTKLSREHVVATPVPGLTLVAGGKYTTYRIMARDAVDEAVKDLGEEVAESSTDKVPLAGAVGWEWLSERPQILARSAGIDEEHVETLLERYGTLTKEILVLINAQPELGELLPGGETHLKAEVVYAAATEGAMHLTDILTRRTRISIEARDRGLGAAPHAAALAAPILGWDAARVANEIDIYHRRVEAEMSSQMMPDDESADQVRRLAPDGAL
ncbi:FAD-dependent oxidoreductase [Knoellia flava TL1]|uniref:Glycerol-3-phosphate dehydrogenase n=2 Tax=Knoellia flava TaxID=913969 RepID=A0A8H9FU41_9MICO|nr:glycerol-3-phosphate dehydrogenase/oxidase [Knoellia flava]KGN30115.1 FAD-dependent oxidoreductase [Knoellia flava TL1]GGB72653.1 FAD-dependent oxidoreductase [Knoellia flava]